MVTKDVQMRLRSKSHTVQQMLVDFAIRQVQRFERRSIIRRNAIEHLAYTVTNGDPTMQRFRDRLLGPTAEWALRLGVNANSLSIFGVVSAFCAAVFAGNVLLFAAFLAVNLFCDGFDGVVARKSDSESDFGSIVDIAADTVSLIVVSIGLAFHGVLNSALAVPYIVVVSVYTFRSAIKNKVISGRFLSVGSRVIAFGGLLMVSVLSGFEVLGLGFSFSVNILFGSIVVLLFGAYLGEILSRDLSAKPR